MKKRVEVRATIVPRFVLNSLHFNSSLVQILNLQYWKRLERVPLVPMHEQKKSRLACTKGTVRSSPHPYFQCCSQNVFFIVRSRAAKKMYVAQLRVKGYSTLDERAEGTPVDIKWKSQYLVPLFLTPPPSNKSNSPFAGPHCKALLLSIWAIIGLKLPAQPTPTWNGRHEHAQWREHSPC